MRLHTRFFILLGTLFLATALAFSLYGRLERILHKDLVIDQSQKDQAAFDKIVALKGKPILAFANGWSCWDEIIDLVHKGGEAMAPWGSKNIDPYTTTFEFNICGIFDLDGRRSYAFATGNTLPALSFPTGFFNLLHEERFLHFFRTTPAGIMEFRAATLHPSDDYERKKDPQGYFIVGRLWDKAFIDDLAALTDSTIEVQPRNEPIDPAPPDGSIVFSRTLSDFNGDPVAILRVRTTSRSLSQLRSWTHDSLLLLLTICLISFAACIFAIFFWIRIPLSRITRTLASENTKHLGPLTSDHSELGSIARLIERSFAQRQELIDEIRERQKTKESLNKLSLALEQTADSVFITDRNAVIEYVNPAFEKLTGYSKDESIGRTPSFLKSGRHDAAFYLGMTEVINAGKTFRNIVTNKRKDGTLFDVEKTITPIKNAQGTITHFVSIDKDVTTRREMEKAQRLSQLGKLISDISHEVNNPLQIISGRAELALLDLKDTDLVRESLQVITDQCQRAKNIILRVLQFSKPARYELKEVDVARAAEDTLAIIESQFRLSGITILRNFAPDLPRIYADEKQVQEVLMNLLTNARDAIKNQGRITVSARRSGQFVELKIKDTGKGMEQGTLAHATEPFFTTKEKGTGLGLHISYNIVRGHGGDLKIESNVGLGTTVTLLWPIRT